MTALPLQGLLVVDFSTLLPGPMASLVLAEAGARVVKVERPGTGDEMRLYEPRFATTSVNFALLNRGKESVVADLKGPADKETIRRLVDRADVVIEQFRPGVMDRLGLGYDAVARTNPGVVYCSISGFGQTGKNVGVAGHDLNYLATAGILDLVRDGTGAPTLPPALIADIAGGAYPAVMNILLALVGRERSGRGAHLDVSMTDNLFPLLYWALGNTLGAGRPPRPGGELVTGGSPRYRLYRTADGRFLAAAPLEDRFWNRFCAVIGLDEPLRDDSRDPDATAAAVAAIIAGRTSEAWERVLAGEDVCCTLVRPVGEAIADPALQERGLFDHEVRKGDAVMPALPVPVAAALRPAPAGDTYPELGEHDDLPGGEP
jgi:crotonobetainyl-CoA:carnitine CoA-transferase CaiB-like acyl-CoA transferase